MWIYDKKLQFPVNVRRPDARTAKIVITQFGGPDGELAASQRYLSQRYAMPYDEVKATLTDIGTEEQAHRLCRSGKTERRPGVSCGRPDRKRGTAGSGESARLASQSGKGLQAPRQNTVEVGDAGSVVGHRNAGVSGAFQAELHFPVVEHTAAAVDYHAVGG